MLGAELEVRPVEAETPIRVRHGLPELPRALALLRCRNVVALAVRTVVSPRVDWDLALLALARAHRALSVAVLLLLRHV
jgi:hypothetical protein